MQSMKSFKWTFTRISQNHDNDILLSKIHNLFRLFFASFEIFFVLLKGQKAK